MNPYYLYLRMQLTRTAEPASPTTPERRRMVSVPARRAPHPEVQQRSRARRYVLRLVGGA